MISLTNYDFQWARSELVIIYPENWISTYPQFWNSKFSPTSGLNRIPWIYMDLPHRNFGKRPVLCQEHRIVKLVALCCSPRHRKWWTFNLPALSLGALMLVDPWADWTAACSLFFQWRKGMELTNLKGLTYVYIYIYMYIYHDTSIIHIYIYIYHYTSIIYICVYHNIYINYIYIY